MATEPTEFQKDLVHSMYVLRGRIVSSYAQVEYLLADLSVKLEMKFKYAIKKRVNAARAIAERPDFLPYKKELLAICADLDQYEEMRHMMAHGFLALTVDRAQNHRFEMRMYQSADEGGFNRLEIETTQVKLAYAAEHINQFAQRTVRLFERIYRELGLERADAF